MLKKQVSRGVKIGGGLLVIGAIVGAYLGNLIPGLGGGQTAGNGELVVNVNSAPEPSDPAEEEPAAPEPGDVLEVFIKGRVYSVADGTSGETTAVSLERVIELAKAVPGDGNGIRVKVSRDPTSRTTAEIALRDKLIAAGISKEAIAGLDEAVD